MNKQAHVIFRGRVQGVWFRAFTAEQARAAGLAGWVRNLADGSVEALFAGDELTIRQTIEKCRQGPPAARVENIETEWSETLDAYASFEIR